MVAILAAATGLAAVIDLRTRRIPNALTGSLAVVGLGLAAAQLGTVGIGGAVIGCLLGFAFMLPGNMFGATGAGDVKLFAAAGALLGPATTVRAFFFTAIAGGVLALVVALHRRRLAHTIGATARSGGGWSVGSGGHRVAGGRQPVCVCAGDCDWRRDGGAVVVRRSG